MQSLFEPAARQEILGRLDRFQSTSPRQWGKMNAAQMLEHCALALEMGTGDRPLPHSLIGKIFSPFVKKGFVGDKPFGRNAPTDPRLVVSDERDFTAQKERLAKVI